MFWLWARSTAACAAPFLAKRKGRGKFVRAVCRNHHSGKLACEKLRSWDFFTLQLLTRLCMMQYHISALNSWWDNFFHFLIIEKFKRPAVQVCGPHGVSEKEVTVVSAVTSCALPPRCWFFCRTFNALFSLPGPYWIYFRFNPVLHDYPFLCFLFFLWPQSPYSRTLI